MVNVLAETSESSGDSFLLVPSTGLIVWTLVAWGIWLGLAVAVGRYGRRHGQGFWALFLCSVVFSPVAVFVVAWLVLQRRGPADVNT